MGAGARQGHRHCVGRCAGPALHGAQAQEPAGARPRAPARGDHRRLQRHDLRGDLRRDRGAPQGPHPLIRKWRPKHRAAADSLEEAGEACSPSPACRRASERAHTRQTQSSHCTTSSSDGSKRRPCCHPRTPLPCCSGRCSPPARSTCARPMARKRLPPNPSISQLTSQLNRYLHVTGDRHREFQPLSGLHPRRPLERWTRRGS